MAKIYIEYIKKDILRAAPQFRNLARGASLARFKKLKREMISEFLNHSVTKEIEAGQDADPISGTVSRGNLFSFIGFEEGADPITPVVNLLEEVVDLDEAADITMKRNLLVFGFRVFTPTKKEIAAATPLPWMIGRSWLHGVEDGISGIGNYLFHQFFPREKSRSTTGLQSKSKGMGATFTPREDYLSNMLRRFKDKV